MLHQLHGFELEQRLHRWARYASRLLGGAVHKSLIGGEPIDVDQIPHVIDANGDIVEIGNAMNGDQFMQALIQINDFPAEFPDDLIHPHIDHGPVVDMGDGEQPAQVLSDSEDSVSDFDPSDDSDFEDVLDN